MKIGSDEIKNIPIFGKTNVLRALTKEIMFS